MPSENKNLCTSTGSPPREVWWEKITGTNDFNSVRTRCIVKGEAQKSLLFWRFSGALWFSQDRLLCGNSTRKHLDLIKSLIFTNAPCKSTCLYNAPSMHTVDDFAYFSRRLIWNNGAQKLKNALQPVPVRRFSFPVLPVVALNRSSKSQIAARYAAFWHAIPQIALASFL